MQLRRLNYLVGVGEEQRVRRADEPLYATGREFRERARRRELAVPLLERLPRGLEVADAGSTAGRSGA
jgi:DNA-binding transcriptional LysR family regulator